MKVYKDLNTVIRSGHVRRVRESNNAGIISFIVALVLFIIIFCVEVFAAADIDMDIIAQIESSGCINLVGDNGKALGCHQLHAGVVSDYNETYDTDFIHWDVMNDDISYMIANWYMNTRIPIMLEFYGVRDNLENRLTAYNMGIGSVIKNKQALKYINAYKQRSN